MNPILQEAIAGAPVLVKLGRRGQEKEYPLEYSIQAVILYKNETAALDRRRAADRQRQGVAKLTRSEISELRRRRQTLLAEAQGLRPAKGQKWEDGAYAQFDALLEEATLLKTAVDEDAGTGDSLYDLYNWRKISPDGDPERLLLALWAGLHRFEGRDTGKANLERCFVPIFSRELLGQLIHPGNATDVALAISKALSAHIIPAPDPAAAEMPEDQAREELDPNPPPPEPAIPAEAHRPSEWKERLRLS